MKSRWLFTASLAVGTAVLVFIFDRYGEGALALLARDFSVGFLFAFVSAGAATLVCLAWRWRFLLAGITHPPGLAVMTLYRSAAHSLAILIPSGKIGGDPLRVWLSIRGKVEASAAIASVTVDRTLEIASTAPFSLVFAAILLQQGVPRVDEAMLTMAVGTFGLLFGIVIAVRRLRRGSGLVTALVERMKIDRFGFVSSRVEVLESSERDVTKLSNDTVRLRTAFASGLVANGLVVVEFALLLAAFGLPTDPVAIVAALFATGAAHLLPVPAGIGVLEGAQVWIFSMLGYPADVGFAVGLVARLRELLWMLPGLIYMAFKWFRAVHSPARSG